jgi:hypothetical protein
MIWGIEKHPIKGLIAHRKCKKCKTAEKPHYSKGLCERCYALTRKDYQREYWRTHYRKD